LLLLQPILLQLTLLLLLLLLLLPPPLLLPGHMHGINTAVHPGDRNDLALAEHIAGGCYEMYRQSPSGNCCAVLVTTKVISIFFVHKFVTNHASS
jgi:hypothetical protein